ncbi:MFS transporter [Glycomyces sp. NPDC046736]|uniref:MFS transporter n=1 Tax=Glycomyces sp. NPDC046736 TaxID=3155615 RepID=UPI003401D6E4
MTDTTTLEASTAPHPLRWRLLGFLGAAQLMLILDVTVVAIALPHMESDLGLSRAALTWTVSAYTLAFGGLMLLGGRIADLLGSKRVVLAGLAVFTVASLVTGLATSTEMLVGGRIAQGVGAAMLSPAALSMVVTLFDGAERNKALGVWSALGGGGAALGLLVGGLLTAGPGWPWVFFVNVPIGIVIFVVLAALAPKRSGAGSGRVDVFGALLVTASSAALIYGLINAGEAGWLSANTGWFVLAAVVGYAVFALWQRKASVPLMDLKILTRRPVATGTFLILMATVLMIAVFFLGTFYFQHARGYGALHTGLLFLPVALGTMLGANLTGRILAKAGTRTPAVMGLVVAAAGLGIAALWTNPVAVTIGVAVAGAGTGALYVVASATALGQVAPHEAGIASGLVSTFHEFGASIGVAVVSSVAAVSLVGDTITGFADGFAVAAIAAVAAALVAVFLTPGRQKA